MTGLPSSCYKTDDYWMEHSYQPFNSINNLTCKRFEMLTKLKKTDHTMGDWQWWHLLWTEYRNQCPGPCKPEARKIQFPWSVCVEFVSLMEMTLRIPCSLPCLLKFSSYSQWKRRFLGPSNRSKELYLFTYIQQELSDLLLEGRIPTQQSERTPWSWHV